MLLEPRQLVTWLPRQLILSSVRNRDGFFLFISRACHVEAVILRIGCFLVIRVCSVVIREVVVIGINVAETYGFAIRVLTLFLLIENQGSRSPFYEVRVEQNPVGQLTGEEVQVQ